MEINAQELRGVNKINYREKNLDYIQKLKQKKQREVEQKLQLQKKQQHRRENLKRKILQQAIKARENKLKELKDIDINIESPSKMNSRTNPYIESLPKISTQKQKVVYQTLNQKKTYEQKYLMLLQSIGQSNKSKRDMQDQEKKKKEERVNRLKEDLGFNKVDSKISFFRSRKQSTELESRNKARDRDYCARSQSAKKFESLIEIAENQLPKTNKQFKRKNEEHLQKIRKRRIDQAQIKQQQRLKKERLKEKLKDYVMYTVKKNVQDGVYDDEFDKKPKRGNKDNQEDQKSSEEQSDEEQKDNSKRKPRKMRNFPHVTDLNQWKKKNRLEHGEKVFIVTGGYPEFKKALKERGWVQNPDCHSPCFDMKYTLQGREIDYNNILDFQMVNHYQKNGVITTKLGLTKSLKNSVWINDISEDSFYPKCFDLNDEGDYVAFQTHFKVCKALSILKIYADSTTTRKDDRIAQEKGLLEDLKLRTEVAICVCTKNIEDLDDIIDKKKYPQIITQKQWEILASDQLNEESLAKKKHEEWIKSIDCKFGGSKTTKKQQIDKKKIQNQNIEKQQNDLTPNEAEGEVDQLLEKVQEILGEYKKRFPHQYDLTGHNNIWILKPAGLSRGRGITCYNHFVEIQDHVKCKQSLWIAQKYIENPLVILKRKFDIRQWVLITDLNPLTIWVYDECYIRFSAIDYNASEVSNKFIHLTNNSIGAYHKDFDKSSIKGNMFFQEECRNYLKQKEGYDVFEQKVRPQMKEIIKKSMLCSLDGIQNRKNTYELFGYDFMIDENYKVWLIEVNSSPSMDYSTHVTSKLVKEVLHDLAKVIIDHANAPKKEKKHIDTGKFKRIYKGIEVSEKNATAGLNLCLEGIPIKKSKRLVIKSQNVNLQQK